MKHYKHIFVVLVYRNTDVLDGFFKSLEEKVIDFKVVLVNSYYDDSSLEACRAYAERFNCDFLATPNKGYGAGNNIGIAFALENYWFDFLIVSNSDIIIRKLDSLDEFIDKECVIGPETIMLTGKKQNPGQGRYPLLIKLYFILSILGFERDSRFFITCSHACSRFNKILTYLLVSLSGQKIIRVFSVHGSFLIFTAKAVKKLAPVFCDEMFLYNEELFLGLKARKFNIPVYYSKNNLVNHLEGASGSGDYWKQYPHYKKSFGVLKRYIDTGYFSKENC